MSKTNRVSLADLGFAITIPDGWRRITHSMWSPAYPAMHYTISKDDWEQADYELTCSRQAAIRQSSQSAAKAIEQELAQAYSRFAHSDTKLGGHDAVRLDCTDAFGAPEYMRHYCLEHNGHLMKLRFLSTSRSAHESMIDAMAGSIELGDPATECALGELALPDYAPAALECVIVGAIMAHETREELSGRHLLASLVRGDSGIAASILRSLGVTVERLGIHPWTEDDAESDFDMQEIRVSPAVFSLLTHVVPRYARETIRSHHVLLGILSKENASGGCELLEDLGVGPYESRAAVAKRISQERDTSCAFCSFCHKPQLDVTHLFPSAFSHICDECVAACKTLAGDGQPGEGVMRRYSGPEKKDVFTGCGHCGAKSDLFTAPHESYFVCGACVAQMSAIAP
ncbi:MAG: hypothetical protein OXU77_04385 [Gammaproteobacteria bacterium]|nr:hypothetical protein [Gammaproteobacteria bacterium]MDE0441499.1 hypothetical protein [Gammaproteobacteria bacterium]